MRTILLFLALISAVCVSGQDYYPQEGGTVKGDDDITFKVQKRIRNSILLSNVTNTRGESSDLYYKDGRELTTKDEYEKIVAETIDGGVEQAVRATFSERELEPLRRLEDTPLIICYVVTPEGETAEVGFILSGNGEPEILTIAPSKWALLEKNIKKYVKWTLNDFAKQLMYIRGMSFLKFYLVEPDPLQTSPFEPLNPNPTPPLPPDDPEGPRGPGDGSQRPETGIGGTT